MTDPNERIAQLEKELTVARADALHSHAAAQRLQLELDARADAAQQPDLVLLELRALRAEMRGHAMDLHGRLNELLEATPDHIDLVQANQLAAEDIAQLTARLQAQTQRLEVERTRAQIALLHLAQAQNTLDALREQNAKLYRRLNTREHGNE
jgi:MFS superfamily sulfate permease-like transporter